MRFPRILYSDVTWSEYALKFSELVYYFPEIPSVQSTCTCIVNFCKQYYCALPLFPSRLFDVFRNKPNKLCPNFCHMNRVFDFHTKNKITFEHFKTSWNLQFNSLMIQLLDRGWNSAFIFKRLRPLIKIMESWTKHQQQPNRHNKRTPQICPIWYSRIQAHLQPLKLYGFNLHASFTFHHPYLHESRPEPLSIHHLKSFQPLFSF